MRSARLVCLVLFWMMAVGGAPASASSESLLRLEINKAADVGLNADAGSFHATTDSTWALVNVPAGDILGWFYAIPSTRILAQEPLPSGRFSVKAEFPPGSSSLAVPLVQEAVLAAFAVACTLEVREIEVMVMSVPEHRSSEFHLPPADSESYASWGPEGDMHWGMLDMDTFALVLESYGGWSVLNETALSGNYELSLCWNPEDTSTLIRAVEELGLSLSPELREIEVLVVRGVGPTSARPKAELGID